MRSPGTVFAGARPRCPALLLKRDRQWQYLKMRSKVTHYLDDNPSTLNWELSMSDGHVSVTFDKKPDACSQFSV